MRGVINIILISTCVFLTQSYKNSDNEFINQKFQNSYNISNIEDLEGSSSNSQFTWLEPKASAGIPVVEGDLEAQAGKNVCRHYAPLLS